MEQVALVFDLDGTLVDSLPDLRAALNEMLRGLARRAAAGNARAGCVARSVCRHPASARPNQSREVARITSPAALENPASAQQRMMRVNR
jgi:phosphoglycolate phosphatase-like HAD superfamily hydrolase